LALIQMAAQRPNSVASESTLLGDHPTSDPSPGATRAESTSSTQVFRALLTKSSTWNRTSGNAVTIGRKTSQSVSRIGAKIAQLWREFFVIAGDGAFTEVCVEGLRQALPAGAAIAHGEPRRGTEGDRRIPLTPSRP
jgi:hypothetical protein